MMCCRDADYREVVLLSPNPYAPELIVYFGEQLSLPMVGCNLMDQGVSSHRQGSPKGDVSHSNAMTVLLSKTAQSVTSLA
ncbi:hypothetical protein EJB05_17994 [Eragrostis curvula]|uniref:Uncharacterized protein n=2 Tax=Eragrostis curvula TaxID=38414 RepID=A0A5J9VKF6_9POAL|nr:hypothetical protein EJB05_17994 [Eragrostis curvula]